MEQLRDKCEKELGAHRVLIEEVDTTYEAVAPSKGTAAERSPAAVATRAAPAAAQRTNEGSGSDKADDDSGAYGSPTGIEPAPSETTGTSTKIPVEDCSSDEEGDIFHSPDPGKAPASPTAHSDQQPSSPAKVCTSKRVPVEMTSGGDDDGKGQPVAAEHSGADAGQAEPLQHPGEPPQAPMVTAVAHKDAGNKAQEAGNLDEAEREYTAAHDAHPGCVAALGNRALVYAKREDWSQVVRVCTRVLASKTAPPNVARKAWLRRAKARHELGDSTGAMADIKVCCTRCN